MIVIFLKNWEVHLLRSGKNKQNSPKNPRKQNPNPTFESEINWTTPWREPKRRKHRCSLWRSTPGDACAQAHEQRRWRKDGALLRLDSQWRSLLSDSRSPRIWESICSHAEHLQSATTRGQCAKSLRLLESVLGFPEESFPQGLILLPLAQLLTTPRPSNAAVVTHHLYWILPESRMNICE